MVLKGASILGFDQIPDAPHPLRERVERFWSEMRTMQRADPWFNVFRDIELGAALRAIRTLLDAHQPSPHPIPDFDVVHSLVQQLDDSIPPVGFRISSEGDGDPICSTIDFRHVIYAGWIVSRSEAAISFDLINRLCQHAIMQQSAIDLKLRGAA